jgi:hypothetical protein
MELTINPLYSLSCVKGFTHLPQSFMSGHGEESHQKAMHLSVAFAFVLARLPAASVSLFLTASPSMALSLHLSEIRTHACLSIISPLVLILSFSRHQTKNQRVEKESRSNVK